MNNNQNMNNGFGQTPNSTPDQNMNNGFGQTINNMPNQNMNNGFGQTPNSTPNQNMNSGFGQTPNSTPDQNMNSGFGQTINNMPNQNMNNTFNPNFNNTNFDNAKPKKKNTKLIIIIAIVVGLLAIIGGRLILALIATGPTLDMLEDGRKEAFVSDAKSVYTQVKSDYVIYDLEGKHCYSLAKLNEMSERSLGMSPTGKNYDSSSYVIMEKDSMGNYTGGICLVDEEGIGISYTSEENISKDSVTTGVTCTLPPECN